MEVVGLVLWPALGLAIIIWKCIQEKPWIIKGILSTDMLMLLLCVLAPPYFVFAIAKCAVVYLDAWSAKVVIALVLVAFIASVVFFVFMWPKLPDIRRKMKLKRDPGFVPPSVEELDRMVIEHDREHGITSWPYHDPRYMRSRRDTMRKCLELEYLHRSDSEHK